MESVLSLRQELKGCGSDAHLESLDTYVFSLSPLPLSLSLSLSLPFPSFQDLAKCESEMQAWEQAAQNSKTWFEEYVSDFTSPVPIGCERCR